MRLQRCFLELDSDVARLVLGPVMLRQAPQGLWLGGHAKKRLQNLAVAVGREGRAKKLQRSREDEAKHFRFWDRHERHSYFGNSQSQALASF